VGQDLSSSGFRALAEFRYHIRRFLRYSEEAARAHGLEPQQHQLLLAIKGLPPEVVPTIGELAARLQIRHHSTVELINRLSERGAIARSVSKEDRREVRIRLTAAGERLLHTLTVEHRDELHRTRPELIRTLKAVLKDRVLKNQVLKDQGRKRAKDLSASRRRPEKMATGAGTGAG
jgi:DNA-binding MarR family transcriptional regulator